MKRKIVLIDMDGTVADFEKGFVESAKNNNWIVEKTKNKMHLKISGDKDQEKRYFITSEKNFYLNLEPIFGAVEAVKEILADKNFEVFFCTSPLIKYKNCVPEKYQWIEKYFGLEATKKIIITRDKTLVKGDYLIDDKPEILGAVKNPDWEHIYFTQPYNKNLRGKRITDWKEWRDIIK